MYNHRDPDYLDAIAKAYPSGFDICIEMLASTNLAVDFSLMAVGGRVVIVGSRGPIHINPRDIMSKELSVHGVMLFAATDKDITRTAALVNELLVRGLLDPTVSLVLPLEDAPTAHLQVIERSRVAVGNIVLEPDHQSPLLEEATVS